MSLSPLIRPALLLPLLACGLALAAEDGLVADATGEVATRLATIGYGDRDLDEIAVANGREAVISAHCNGLDFRRQVRRLPDSEVVRVVDRWHNPDAAALTVEATLGINWGNYSQALEVVRADGVQQLSSSSAQQGDLGLVITTQEQEHISLVWSGGRAPAPPGLDWHRSRSGVSVEYEITVEPGETLALVYLIAPGRQGEALVERFGGHRLAEDLRVEAELAQRCYNHPVSLPVPDAAGSLPIDLDGDDRWPEGAAESDVLVFPDGGALTGTIAADGELGLAGGASIPVGDIVGLLVEDSDGGLVARADGRRERVRWTPTSAIGIQTQSGGRLAWKPGEAEPGTALLRAGGLPAVPTPPFVALDDGQVLRATVAGDARALTLATPWGRLDPAWGSIDRLERRESPQRHWLVTMADGSEFPTLLVPGPTPSAELPAGRIRFYQAGGEHLRDRRQALPTALRGEQARPDFTAAGSLGEVVAGFGEHLGVAVALADDARIYAQVPVEVALAAAPPAVQLSEFYRHTGLVVAVADQGLVLHDPDRAQRGATGGQDLVVLATGPRLFGELRELAVVPQREELSLDPAGLVRLEREWGGPWRVEHRERGLVTAAVDSVVLRLVRPGGELGVPVAAVSLIEPAPPPDAAATAPADPATAPATTSDEEGE